MKWIGRGIVMLAIWGGCALVAVKSGDTAIMGAAVIATLIAFVFNPDD